MRRIVILGGGFGGFEAARELERTLMGRRRVQLTLVSDTGHFLYTPLLTSVASGQIEIDKIRFPLRQAFDETTEIIVDRIEAIDLDSRCLHGRHTDVEFDYLVVACGSQVAWPTEADWQTDARPCKTAEDAQKLRASVRQALRGAADASSADQRRQQLTFVIGGAGATGVELAAELWTALQAEVIPVVDDAIADALRIVIVEQQQRLVPRMVERLGQLTRTHLQQLGVELRIGAALVDRTPHAVELSTGEVIAADHLWWCGGISTPDVVADADFEFDAAGRIAVNETLQVRGRPGVYAVGDVAGAGDDISQTAQVASQQGPAAGRNIVADLSGRASRSWQYQHHGTLVALGRQHALAHLAGTVLQGRGARTLHRLVHTALMPPGPKRAELLKDWLFPSVRRSADNWKLIPPPSRLLGPDDA